MSAWHPQWIGLPLGPSSHSDPSVLKRHRIYKMDRLMERGFPFSRRLRGHASCVNSLAFSNGDGRWLASGGDDPHILLWDFHQDDLHTPSRMFHGHTANVFAVAFSATNQHLYTGDTDNAIIRYDLGIESAPPGPQKSHAPDAVFRQHEDSIRAISCHPEQDDIFMSAGEDGRIIMHDARADSRLTRAQGTLQHDAEFTGLQFHPTMHNIFVTSDSRGQVCLRDTRIAFGPLCRRRQNGIVQTYVTTITKPSFPWLCNPEVSSVTFDSTGTKLAATMMHYLPTIYSVTDPYPIAVCSGEALSTGPLEHSAERTYSNGCTIKHGSFGGPGMGNDHLYCAGSDDFRAYVWRIPDPMALVDRRESHDASIWTNSGNSETVGYRAPKSGTCYVPYQLNAPLCRITGHQSIVNTALMHPHYPYIITSGIERDIILHSSTPTSPSAVNLPLTPTEVRSLPPSTVERRRLVLHAMGLIGGQSNDTDDNDDSRAIALFDEILRQEGSADVFTIRRCNETLEEEHDSDDASEETTVV
ncbi:WD40 repeat-like protein [Laetiporus sulphureus 93-53]|uniref:WD40 repeat-like protein n=1 Tax=Laetiporus sulphureus 93-53 TaxID=1314785 RepID=A0A165HUM0_9APHY|nr:WD40 repeat-like protein [Laetiporus sulphureus 93-53]KZT12209.1 WD40 repeat-like protein [Laetiporus sulphureus 93-53]